MKKLKKLCSRKTGQGLILLVSCIALATNTVSALSQDQLNAFGEGAFYFNTEDSISCSSSASVPAGNLPTLIPEPYNGAFTAAGNAYNVSPILIASIFTEEHFTGQDTGTLAGSWQGLLKSQPDPNSGWATSPDQAMGPFQFIPATWASLGVDADHNGVKDVENLLDAAYGAANYMKTDGATADKPKSVWVQFADGYSGHTGGYADQVSKYIDFYAGGGTPSASSSLSSTATDNTLSTCGNSAVSGNIAQTALNFAWDDYPAHHKLYGAANAKSSYVSAVQQYLVGSGNDPNSYTTAYTDCGAFVATVMRASGVDPSYEPLGTSRQLAYVQQHPSMYSVLAPGQWNPTTDPRAGDIFISNGHTYIYVGKQASGFSVAEASQGEISPVLGANGHVPEVDAMPYPAQTINGVTEQFYLVRVK